VLCVIVVAIRLGTISHVGTCVEDLEKVRGFFVRVDDYLVPSFQR
jgi:hypothetical protein